MQSDGDLVSAEASFAESLTIARDLTDPFATMWALEGFAELAAAKHAPKRAATILGAAARLREEIGLAIPRARRARAQARGRGHARGVGR